MKTSEKITQFEDMPVWQESMDFDVEVYKHLDKLPDEEKYGLQNQMRRSASSVSANIAEGFGRGSLKDRAHFYHIAMGSLLETKNFIYLAGRLRYFTQEDVDGLVKRIESIIDQINAIQRYFNNHA